MSIGENVGFVVFFGYWDYDDLYWSYGWWENYFFVVVVDCYDSSQQFFVYFKGCLVDVFVVICFGFVLDVVGFCEVLVVVVYCVYLECFVVGYYDFGVE